ncbi:MAG: hypothetical protein AB8G23_00445 [Myxococcota bacterium]
MSSKLLQIAALLIAVTCTGWAHSRVPPTTRGDLGQGFVPDPALASATSLGFDALLADYHWIQAVQLVGAKTSVDQKAADHIGKVIDVVTTLNPHVEHPYRFAALWLNFNEGQVREGNRLLRRAIENHPEDWRNHYYLGFNHFFYLSEHEEAAEALEAALALPGSPPYLGRLVARIKSQAADIDVAEVFLRELLGRATDPAAIARLEGALDEIEIEYKARYLDRSREAYQALVGRDIDRIEDLIEAPHRMISVLPNPEPDSMPESLRRGSRWEIDPKTDRIISSYLGSRYEVHFSGGDEVRLGKTFWNSDSDEVSKADVQTRSEEENSDNDG